MTKHEAIEYYKTPSALAAAIGVSPGAISQWKAIPWDRQMQIESLTKRKLKADPNPHLTQKVAA